MNSFAGQEGEEPQGPDSAFAFRDLFLLHPQPMWIFDLETRRFLAVNNAAVERYGYSRDEFLAMSIMDIRAPADAQALASYLPDYRDRPFGEAGIWRHRYKDGTVIHAQITTHRLVFQGRPARLIMSQDVTARVMADSRLRRAEALLRIAGRSARLGGWIVELKTRQAEFSDEVCSIHEVPPGYSPTVEEAIGFYPPAWRDRVTKVFADCAEHGTPFDEELELLTAKGRRIWVRTIGEAVRDADGAIVQVQGAFQDITEQKRQQILQDFETRILGLISAQATLNHVFDELIRGVEALLPGATASILTPTADRHALRQAAGENLPDRFVQSVEKWASASDTGAWAAALHRGEPVIAADIATDPLWQDIRQDALAHGLRSCWAIPVRLPEGEIPAIFAIWFGAIRSPGEKDSPLTERAASLAALAIGQSRALDSLRVAEERFRQLAENVGEVFWIREASGQVVYVSPGYETIWGRSCESLYRDSSQWIAAIHEEDRPQVLAGLARLLDEDYVAEYRIVRADGQVRWIADRGFPVFDREGQAYRDAGTARDVTDQKLIEQSLRESEHRFQTVARATTDVIWDWDLIEDHMWWSEDFETRFGHSRDDMSDGIRGWAAQVHAEDRDRVLSSLLGAVDRREPVWQAEYRFMHRDGHVMEVRDSGCLILDDEGRPVRFVGGLQDVTERNRAQQELRERIKELRCLYQVLELTGHDERPVAEICADIARLLPDSLTHEEDAIARVVLDGAEYRSARWQDPAARLHSPVRSGSAVVGLVETGYRERHDEVPGGLGPFLADERAMVDATAAHIGRMLENRRMTERLTQSERLRAVGELTGGIAHDFNNLLQVILGNAELLADSLATEPQLRTLAELTRTAAERGADLTSRLLAFSRRQTLEPKIVEVAALIGEMDGLLRRTLGEHIAIATTADPDLWRTSVDPSQLENAVLNLCINARDAMPDGGRLTIEMANQWLDESYVNWNDEVVPGPYVMVAISDTGIGMDAATASRAFEPFFTTKDVGRGSGLGLSMVFGFAKQSRGHVTLYSEPGQGTTVKLYLPRAAQSDALPVPMAPPPAITQGQERILLVEDDELVRGHVQSQLESLGYRVVSVGDGPSAMKVLETDTGFDLLFTDVVMSGGLSGPMLAERAAARLPGLPVLFTSGYTENAIVHHGRLDPGVQLLQKPYRRQDLALKLRQVPDARGSPDQGRGLEHGADSTRR